MEYTIGQAAKILELSTSTLRYYDKEGLLPYVNRTSGNTRMFTDQGIECLRIIACLKKTGLQLKDIRQFFSLCQAGDSTISKRYELFVRQK